MQDNQISSLIQQKKENYRVEIRKKNTHLKLNLKRAFLMEMSEKNQQIQNYFDQDIVNQFKKIQQIIMGIGQNLEQLKNNQIIDAFEQIKQKMIKQPLPLEEIFQTQLPQLIIQFLGLEYKEYQNIQLSCLWIMTNLLVADGEKIKLLIDQTQLLQKIQNILLNIQLKEVLELMAYAIRNIISDDYSYAHEILLNYPGIYQTFLFYLTGQQIQIPSCFSGKNKVDIDYLQLIEIISLFFFVYKDEENDDILMDQILPQKDIIIRQQQLSILKTFIGKCNDCSSDEQEIIILIQKRILLFLDCQPNSDIIQSQKQQDLIDLNFHLRCFQLFYCPNIQIQIHSLAILGQLLMYNEHLILSIPGFFQMLQFNLKNSNQTIKCHTCWIVSNFVDFQYEYIENLFNNGIIDNLIFLFNKDDQYVQKQAIIAICNLKYCENQIQQLVDKKFIEESVNYLGCNDTDIIYQLLQMYYKIFQSGQKQSVLKQYVRIFQIYDGQNKLDNLQLTQFTEQKLIQEIQIILQQFIF